MKSIVAALALSLLAFAPACKKKEPGPAEKTAPAPAPAPGAPAAPAAPSSQPSQPPAAPQKSGALPPDGRIKMVDGKKVELFGQDIASQAAPATLASVLEKPESFTGKEVVVTGKVRMACKKKGCWMELAPTLDKTTQGARVTFKNYGFFVPKDSAGADAKVEGVLAVKKVAKSEVDHMEAEGARFAKKDADGSAHEVRVLATGVELIR